MSYVDEIIEQVIKQNPAEPFFFPQAEPDHRGVRLLAVP